MCMDFANQEKSVRQFIRRKQKAGVEYVKVYKRCFRSSGDKKSWLAFYHRFKFRSKLNICKDQFDLGNHKNTCRAYSVGFHSYLKSPSSCDAVLVTCWVPVDSIVAIGTQDCEKVIVSKKIYMPKYPECVAECP